jgi:alkyl hydroperoxide reductase subunit AhpC
VDEDRKKAGEPARQVGAKFPVVHDSTGEIARRYGVSSIPLNVIIDRQGKVVEALIGGDAAALKSAAARLARPR